MEHVSKIPLSNLLPPEVTDAINHAMTMSPEQILKNRCQSMNERVAKGNEIDTSGYDCPRCKNKCLVYHINDKGDIAASPCNCIPIRASINRNKASGLGRQFANCSFDSFEAREPWQKDGKRRAMIYAENPEGWLFICGQVGAGKTLLCTAVVKALIECGHKVQYMVWKTDSAILKAQVNDHDFKDKLNPFVSVDVLYIDDFLKTERGENGHAARPTKGDINLAFQIINDRYNANKLTIISSEHNIEALISFDEATGSRIYEQAGKNRIMFPWGNGNNYRLKNQ